MSLDLLFVAIVVVFIILVKILISYEKVVKSYSHIGMKYIKKGKTAKAVKYLKKAADDGDPVCAYNIGVIYLKGDAVLLDKKVAVKYFKMAYSNAGKGDFKVAEYKKKTDPREAQTKRIKSVVKELWKEDDLWRLGDNSTVMNY